MLKILEKLKKYNADFIMLNSINEFSMTHNENTELARLTGFSGSAGEALVDSKGKIAFANNNSKLSCISYTDGSKMGNFTKYKIINYFAEWLNDNGLITDEVTTSLEDLLKKKTTELLISSFYYLIFSFVDIISIDSSSNKYL